MFSFTDWTARPPRHIEPYSWRVCLAFMLLPTVGLAVLILS
jgi:hypothetical protein